MRDNLSKDTLEPEVLAAFLDGTLSPEERARVLRVLAESPAAYAEFIEASAIHRELAPRHTSIVDTKPRLASPWRKRAGWIGALALAAGVALVFVARRPVAQSDGRMFALVQAAALANGQRSLGAEWDQPGWSVVRGSEAVASPRARAFRAGGYSAELEYAAGLGDSAAARRAIDALALSAGSYDGGAPIASRYRSFADARDFAGPRARATAAGQLRAVGQAGDWFDLGVWIEAARLSLRANDLSPFQKGSDAQRELAGIAASLNDSSATSVESSQIMTALRPIVDGRTWTSADRDSLSAVVTRVTNLGAK